MRLGIKGKQVLGVTSLVGAVVVILSVLHLSRVASVSLDESAARADLIANAVFHRAFAVVGRTTADPYAALRADPGLRSILEASLAYSKNVTYAALVDADGMAVLHGDRSLEGQPLPAGGDLARLLAQSPLEQLRAIYSSQGQNLEHRQPLLLGDREIGSIRIGVSTLLIRDDLNKSLRPVLASALAALAVAVLVAMLLAQLLLRPIHLIRGGLTRLGRGELGVQVNLSENDEFGELGTFFNAVSEQLSVDRSHMAGQVANLESAVEQLEDAVGIVTARGELLFANPALRAILPDAAAGARLDALLPGDHPLRRLAEQTLVSRQARGPVSAAFGDSGERLVMTHAIVDPKGEFVGVMLIARNLEYLSEVQSTVRYSRKLAALGRLSAGVAHEVKNPLNAMMIHLELLRQQVRPTVARPSARASADPRATAVVDEVVQGFLKFTRAEDLKLQPIALSSLLDEIVPIVRPEADRAGVELVIACDGAPDVNGDPAMLRQAFLNLALNACQAMPDGGTLRIACEAARGRRVRVSVSDTGVGIEPEHLQRIFDLYFTTKQKGSGIGLSMVYRTVQMHDGDIEVQSTLGSGTTFTMLLPQA
jgi:signal transduction histidine kinase